MKSYLSKLAENISPYVPGEQPKDKKYIKLNTNENPYPPSRRVYESVSSEIENLKLYPDPESSQLVQTLAEYYGINEENIIVGNGSDEVLGFVFFAFFSGKKIIFPDITYSFYPVYAGLANVEYKEIPLSEDFTIQPDDYMIENQGIIIANPNAPTGLSLGIDAIEKIISANKDSVVIIDEAYIDFGGEGCESAMKLIHKYENLLVIRTLSKSRSLAGLRVGFAVGNKGLIDGINRIKNSFNSYPVDRLAQIGATASIKDNDHYNSTRRSIIRTRKNTTIALQEMEFIVIPSDANFLFVSHKERSAIDLTVSLKEKGILVRHFTSPRIANYIRISIGTDKEMNELVKALKSILGIEKEIQEI